MSQRIIIVGAPRSGTNMLRDILCSFDGVSTWPCDEINFIWRYGNQSFPSDELSENLITKEIKQYINRQFDWVGDKFNADLIVEKTCANSLRLNYVDKLVPDAKYIYIVRNGIDVVESAKKRWSAKLNLKYILKKAKFVPKKNIPYYATRYLKSLVYKLFSSDDRLKFWGPIYHNMENDMINLTIAEACAKQWKNCVDSSDRFFSSISTDKFHSIRYENFVNNPEKELTRILKFLNVNHSPEFFEKSIKDVVNINIGKGRRKLNSEELSRISLIIDTTMKRHSYDV